MSSTFTIGGIEFDKLAYLQTETGKLLGGVTRQHVANMIARGELRAVRVGRRVLVPASEIARLLGELEGDQPGAGDAA